MAELKIDKNITVDVCYRFGSIVQKLYDIAAEIKNINELLGYNTQLSHITEILYKLSSQTDEIGTKLFRLRNLLENEIALYLECENNICQKYYDTYK